MARAGAILITAAVAIAACANPDDPVDFLDPLDRENDSDSFDKDSVLSTAELEDVTSEGLTADSFQTYFLRTAYRRPSFLGSYRSNGRLASEALVRAGLAHRINPLVLLTRAEMDQGLIASDSYPENPDRVEYAFGCGCPGVGNCNPAMAGFDRQVDCLAGKLRAELDAVLGSAKQTTGGWAPGVERMTLDGELVTPTDAGTSVIYEFSPIVGVGKRGAWLFNNVFRLTADSLGYSGLSGTGDGQSWIGDACQANADCSRQELKCALGPQIPGGICTKLCSESVDPCPVEAGKASPACIAFSETQGYCLAQCDLADPNACRQGYECRNGQVFEPTGAAVKPICVWKKAQ